MNELHYKHNVLMRGLYNKILIMQLQLYVTNYIKTECIEIQII